MKMVIDNREQYVLVTPAGNSYEFKKGVPTHIPAKFAALAIAVGARAVEEDTEELKQVQDETEVEEKARVARRPKLEKILREMIERNESGDFTAGGKPNITRVQKRMGEPIERQEIEALFLELVAEKAKG